ncbi:MAG: leucyl aminopeptidase family protein [Saprospiraceae bacterium]|nr:leucyl aminopeptidase family protein [Saprospiraceae bacterium]
MNILISKNPPDKPHDVIAAFQKNQADYEFLKGLSSVFHEKDFAGDAKEILMCYGKDPVQKILMLGLGESKDSGKASQYFRSVIYQNRKKLSETIALYVDHLSESLIYQAVTGTLAGLKLNGFFKYEKEVIPTREICIVTQSARNAQIIREAMLMSDTQLSMMHLVDLPSNVKTPEFIANTAKASAGTHGYTVTVYDKTELETLGMKALLAVGQGSIHPPYLIVAEYKGPDTVSVNPVVGLVGKGISFDTGGLSIKPSANMGYMKSDMAGAAAVLGCIEMAAKLKLNIHMVAILPCAENSVDAYSTRPGDIIGSYSGKSIEVIDTDAEGRLILADGLSYLIKNFNPAHIIDVATLTGSIVQTLGYHAAGIFTQSDDLAKSIMEAADKSGERVWRMPLWDDYMTEMQSDMADIKNLSTKPVAGAITAAKFLEFFTENHPQWLHMDIAGVAFTDTEFTKQRAASGFGIRLLTEFVKTLQPQP